MDKIRIASRAILVGMCVFGDFKVGGYTTKKSSGGGGGGAK